MSTETEIPLLTYIFQLEQEGRVTRTFRRLDPQRQQAVLYAILEEAAERGPAAMNIKEVARRAGVSVGSLYQYFNDRDGMLNFAVELTVRYVHDMFDQFTAYLVAMPLREGLRWYLAGGIEWSREQAGLLKLFARAAYHGDPQLRDSLVKPVAGILLLQIRAMLQAAQARGEVRLDIDLDRTARLVHALTIVAGDSQLLPYLNAYFLVLPPEGGAEQTLEALLDLVMKGLEAGHER